MKHHKHSSYNRYLRKERLYKRRPVIIIGAVLLVILIVVGLLFFVQWRKGRQTVYYSELEDCTLPVLSMEFHGYPVNQLFGYTKEMDMQYIRDNIFILDSGDYDISTKVNMYGNTAKAMEFTLIDPEDRKLIQNTQVTDFEMEEGDILAAILHIDSMIDQDKEYSLDIKLTDSTGREVHYYTRIMCNSTSPTLEMMDFVFEHHDAMYDKSKTEFLVEYQAPNSAVNDSTNFGNISISSTLNSMYWGNMGVSVITEPVISIVDIDNDLGFFRLKYQVSRVNDEGTTEYYNISEYYRIRIYAEKKSILSYERTANQIFDPDKEDIGNKSVLLGIEEDLNIQTMTNPESNMNVFVAGKAVWFMDTNTKTLQKVFSFETSPTDLRQNNDQHNIKLLKIADDGSFQFVVYGYMNRGMHEGQAGIGLYTYHADTDEVMEDIFIPSYMPYQVLKNSLGTLCYLNDEGVLYIMLDEYVYSLDSRTNQTSIFVSGLNDYNFKASSSGRMLAWQHEGDINNASRINVIDLEQQTSYYVSAPEGKNIKVLGFLDNDLVYGEGNSGDIYTADDGRDYLLMTDLYVINKNKEVLLSEHSARGFYVSSETEYNRVVVNTVVRKGTDYEKGDEFTLFSTDLENNSGTSSYTIYDEIKRTINYIEVVKTMEPNKEAVINDTMKITLSSEEAADVGDMISGGGKYYVYAGGEIIDILSNPADAIMSAYYSTGVAIKDNTYFYRRSSRPLTVELTNTSVESAAEEYRNGTALNITGVYLNQALYFTGRKIPVIWEWDEDVFVIVGYDLFDNIMLRNINTGEEILKAYDDIDEIFDVSGRCFITN